MPKELKNIHMQLPESALTVINNLQNNGYEAYAVGGCCRDAILGRIPHDYDICTAATPEQSKAAFQLAGYNTYDTGIQHGTISVMINNELYEVTTFREDGDYTDGRHPDSVSFVSDINADLSRRDFTINAMAYNPNTGLVDPFNGMEDCANKLIRCVGDPNKRFQEDGLRIMRAIRFAATYGFEIEKKTKDAIHANKHLLKNVSSERKTVEFVRMLTQAKSDLLLEYGDVFAEFVPEIKPMFGLEQKTPWHKRDVWEHTTRAVELTPSDPTLRLAVFFHDIGKPATFQIDSVGRGHFKLHPGKSASMTENIMKRMRFDTNSIKTVSTLVKHHDDPLTHNMTPPNIKYMLNDIGEENLRKLVQIQQADKQAARYTRIELENMDKTLMEYEDAVILGQLRALDRYEKEIDSVIMSGEPYQLKDLKINGHDLIGIGITGKDIGDTLNHLLVDVIDNPNLNTKAILMDRAEKYWEYVSGERDMIDETISR